ncbi:hypothetical protein B0I37DRAFT_352944 [Chaetomium sp. MPI-CAGE-AT-0009]|nr:hypothetical protein B0I37DRAFT_352944 [Chaetomium sp. MPI-CAGE-AT-0009]
MASNDPVHSKNIDITTTNTQHVRQNGRSRIILAASGLTWLAIVVTHAQFHIHETNPVTNETSDTASVDFYSVSRVVFLNSTTKDCWIPMADGHSNPSCDWDALFAESPPPEHRATSVNQQVVEYNYQCSSMARHGSQLNSDPHVYSAYWCNSAAHLAFGVYELAATRRLVNTTGDTRLTIDIEPETSEPVYVHPDWLLASWEVSHSGTVPADSYNSAATLLLSRLRRANADGLTSVDICNIHAIVMISALTIIDYDEQLLNDVAPASRSTDRVLENFITSEMWVYNLSSRTRVLGFTVAVVACAIVGLSIALSFAPWPFTGQPTALGLFREGFTQHPPEKLAGLSVDEVGQLPYRFTPG